MSKYPSYIWEYFSWCENTEFLTALSFETVPPHLYVKLVITDTIPKKEGNFAG